MKEYDIIKKPLITEKSTVEAANGKYTFVVDVAATKIDVKMAVEKLFDVKVLAVNTMRYDGKKRSRRQASGNSIGYTAKWKKAIVKIDTDPAAVEYVDNGTKKTKKYKSSIEDFGLAQ